MITRAVIELSGDISSTVMLSLERSIKGSFYDTEDNILSFKLEGKGITVSPKKIGILDVKDESEVNRLMGKIREFLDVVEVSLTG